MTFTVKIRTQPGAPMVCEYECPVHGRFDALVSRDQNGDQPDVMPCDVPLLDDYFPGDPPALCNRPSPLQWSTFTTNAHSWDPIPIGRASKSDEKDPRMLDTEPLATGKMTRREWDKYQRGITQERRHQQRLKSGRHQKRIQVDGSGGAE